MQFHTFSLTGISSKTHLNNDLSMKMVYRMVSKVSQYVSLYKVNLSCKALKKLIHTWSHVEKLLICYSIVDSEGLELDAYTIFKIKTFALTMLAEKNTATGQLNLSYSLILS